MWVRNVVCSVVTLAAVWALSRGVWSVADVLQGRQSFGGLALFAVFGAICFGATYLIARAVDARAARRPGRQE